MILIQLDSCVKISGGIEPLQISIWQMRDYIGRYFGWLPITDTTGYYFERLLEGLEYAPNSGDWYGEFELACKYGMLLCNINKIIAKNEVRIYDGSGGYFLLTKWNVEHVKNENTARTQK